MLVQLAGEVPKKVRKFSMYGPCIKLGPLVGESQKFWLYQDSDKVRRVSKEGTKTTVGVHLEPCERCTDHVKTVYPNGYMD